MKFSKFTDVGIASAHVFSWSDDGAAPRGISLTFTALQGLSTSISLSPKQASEIAHYLLDAADWMLSHEARVIVAREQAERDKIAGGQRPEQHSDERGEFDLSALAVHRAVV